MVNKQWMHNCRASLLLRCCFPSSSFRLWKHCAALVGLPDLLEEHEILQRHEWREGNEFTSYYNILLLKTKGELRSVLQLGSRLPKEQLSSSHPGPAGTECQSCPCQWRPPSTSHSTACWSDRWACRCLWPSAAEKRECFIKYKVL